MRINQNIAALNAYRHLSITDSRLNRSLERLSSGLRINRAADDAAGLAISERMRAQISGLRMAMRNAQDGISLIQTAEGAINEIHSMLQRMRELAVQAANETYTSSDRMEIQKEIDQLKDEIDRISNSTEFNTRKLLDGSSSAIVSSDRLSTHVYMRDGLRYVDQFGQKFQGGGNYRIEVEAQKVGKAQVQKSNIFMIKHNVGHSVQNNHVGHATTGPLAVVSGNTSHTIDLTFTINGKQYLVPTVNCTTAGTTLAEVIKETIDGTEELNDHITVTVTTAGITFTRKDPGDFALKQDYSDAATSISSTDLPNGVEKEFKASEKKILAVNVTEPNNLLNGEYKILTEKRSAAGTTLNEFTKTQEYTASKATMLHSSTITISATANQSISFVVEGVSGSDVTLAYEYTQMKVDGTITSGNGRITVDKKNAAATALNIGDNKYSLRLNDVFIAAGDRFVINTNAVVPDASKPDIVSFHRNNGAKSMMAFAVDGDTWLDKGNLFTFYQLDDDENSSQYGTLLESSVELTWGSQFETENDLLFPAAGFEIVDGGTVGSLASEHTRLYDIREFWDANGRFLLESPQTIFIVQGDGTRSFFTIDQNDTLGTLRGKVNKAINEDLNQGRYLDDSMKDNFATYVTGETKVDGTHVSTEGTLVVRSVIPGRQGELNIFGHADIINALGFATIQQSTETIFNIKVTNAHDAGEVIAKDVQISSNLLVGIVHPHVDVEFDPLAGIGTVTGLDAQRAFETVAGDKHVTHIHLKDSTMIFQIGPNPGQDVGAAIGRLDSRALGVRGISVTDRSKANQAMDSLDRAMDLVSGERSKLGAMQNRLEHTVNSLGVSIENLTSSESRIRDLDLAEEMMEFTRNQILLQAGTAMLAQANMKPQAILQLLG